MHPVERLRYVARASDDGSAMFLEEAAGALASFADDPVALVTACRRLVDRQPANASVWWLAARVLGAADPEEEAWCAASLSDDDSVSDTLVDLLPEEARVVILGWPDLVGSAIARRGDLAVRVVEGGGGEGSALARRLERRGADVELIADHAAGAAVAASDLVLLEAACLGPQGVHTPLGSRALLAVAAAEGLDAWVIAAHPHVLPAELFAAYTRRNAVEPVWAGDLELLPARLLGGCVVGAGLFALDDAAATTSAPVVGELLR